MVIFSATAGEAQSLPSSLFYSLSALLSVGCSHSIPPRYNNVPKLENWITMSQSWEPLILSLFKSPPKMLSRNLKSSSWLPIVSSLSQCDPNPCKLTLTSQDLSLSEGRENEFGLLQPK